MNRNVYSVERVNAYIKNMFSEDFMLKNISVKGELSNVKYHSSGHIYFTLKDEKSSLQAVMFASDRRKLSFDMKEGQSVIVSGRIEVYERDGKYQIYAREIALDGAGALFEKYEKLKEELLQMGMFSEQYKKKLPKYCQKIGVVTAPTGAAIRDIINVTKRRNPFIQIILFPALVQGDGAKESIVNGIRALDELNLDAIIVGRGGGTIEDLWAFNEEIVARAIFECNTPVVSAVGHETDFTIADFVADLRAPTPSVAAELCAFSYDEFIGKIDDIKGILHNKFNFVIAKKRSRYERARLFVEKLSPENILSEKKFQHMQYTEKLSEIFDRKLLSTKHQYEILLEQLKAMSPLDKLSKGYAYVSDVNGKTLKSVKNVKVNDILTLNLKDGVIKTVVNDIEETNKNY